MEVLGSRFLRGFNVFAASSRFRYRQTVRAQPLEMELGGSTNVGEDLVQRLARCDAPRKVGNICREILGTALDHDCVTHALLISEAVLESGRFVAFVGEPHRWDGQIPLHAHVCADAYIADGSRECRHDTSRRLR